MDHITKDKRSWNMSRIRSKNTKPEIVARKIFFSKGYRFRLHRNDLPGKPDLVFSKFHTVIFIHGCFWHQHKGCKRANIPKSNVSYWKSKLQKNVLRDSQYKKQLEQQGWKTAVLWECQLNKPENAECNVQKIIRKYFK